MCMVVTNSHNTEPSHWRTSLYRHIYTYYILRALPNYQLATPGCLSCICFLTLHQGIYASVYTAISLNECICLAIDKYAGIHNAIREYKIPNNFEFSKGRVRGTKIGGYHTCHVAMGSDASAPHRIYIYSPVWMCGPVVTES